VHRRRALCSKRSGQQRWTPCPGGRQFSQSASASLSIAFRLVARSGGAVERAPLDGRRARSPGVERCKNRSGLLGEFGCRRCASDLQAVLQYAKSMSGFSVACCPRWIGSARWFHVLLLRCAPAFSRADEGPARQQFAGGARIVSKRPASSAPWQRRCLRDAPARPGSMRADRLRWRGIAGIEYDDARSGSEQVAQWPAV